MLDVVVVVGIFSTDVVVTVTVGAAVTVPVPVDMIVFVFVVVVVAAGVKDGFCHLGLKTNADRLDIGSGLGDKAVEGQLLWVRLCGGSTFLPSSTVWTKSAHFSLLWDGSDRAGRRRRDSSYSSYGAC